MNDEYETSFVISTNSHFYMIENKNSNTNINWPWIFDFELRIFLISIIFNMNNHEMFFKSPVYIFSISI